MGFHQTLDVAFKIRFRASPKENVIISSSVILCLIYERLLATQSSDITFSRHGAIRTGFLDLQKGGHNFSGVSIPWHTSPEQNCQSRSQLQDKGDLVPRIFDVQQNLTSMRNGRLGREAQNWWRVRDSGTGSRLVTVLRAPSWKNASGGYPSQPGATKCSKRFSSSRGRISPVAIPY